MTRRKRTTIIATVAVAALLVAAGVAWAAGAFPDVDPSDVHAADIQWAADNGIVNGYTNGNFGPYDNITRGQAASMFKNFDDYAKEALSGVAGCKDCHDSSDNLSSKKEQWNFSLHGEGEVFLEDGGEANCTGCHSGGGFSAMIAAGLEPNTMTEGDPSPSQQDCRACHQIHETGTEADWALETEAPVTLYAIAGTFDGGAGNLCTKCHQARRAFPAVGADGKIAVSARFGPHHGPQSDMLLGIGGAGAPAGAPMFHYTAVADTCVTCHMGENAIHTFEPNVERCQTCHADAEDFDIGGTQTEVQAMLDELKADLIAAGLLNAEGAIVVGSYPEAQAAALWNYVYVSKEDKSLGVHNPAYTKAILQAALDALAG